MKKIINVHTNLVYIHPNIIFLIIVFVVIILAIIKGIVFLLFPHSFANLTRKHSFIEKIEHVSQKQDNCFVCHDHSSFKIQNNEKCIDCHTQKLEEITKKDSKKNANEFFFFNAHGLNNDRFNPVTQEHISCNNCHKEHLGRDHNISNSAASQQCVDCHKQQQGSFARSHPEFKSFPYRKRTRIIFDHETHMESYFLSTKVEGKIEREKIPTKCNDCHGLDNTGQFMVIKAYEETCFPCHQQDISRENSDINIIRFPGFDVEQFYQDSQDNDYKPEFSRWPSVDVEDTGEVTNLMRLLLSKDKELSDAEISENLDIWLNDIVMDAPENGDKAELKAINTYVQMIERFCREIVEEDNVKLKVRFEKVLGFSVENDVVGTYFPNLSAILETVQKNLPSIIPGERDTSFELGKYNETPKGWYYENYTIKYRPVNHKDPVMKNWLDLTAAHYKERTSTQYLFESLDRCTKCHSVNTSKTINVQKEVQWKPATLKNRDRFYKFSHKPHLLTNPKTSTTFHDPAMACADCHPMKLYNSEESELERNKFDKMKHWKGYQQGDPFLFESEFEFINKQSCASCHTKAIVGEDCTICHNYHIEKIFTTKYNVMEKSHIDIAIKNTETKVNKEAADVDENWDDWGDEPLKESIKDKDSSMSSEYNTTLEKEKAKEKLRSDLEKAKAKERLDSNKVDADNSVFLTPEELERIKEIDTEKRLRVDLTKIVTGKKCGECHQNEYEVLKKTPHYTTFDLMSKRPRAKDIFENLGEKGSIKRSDRCVSCHFTQEEDRGRPKVTSGVSCESCHGEGKDWLYIHNDRSVPKPERRKNAMSKGMNNPEDIYLIAQTCYRCHSIPDEELVNKGGHTLASDNFELVRWSQGSERHNFVRTNNQENAESTIERLRVLFVTGAFLDLEYSLRGLALATQQGPYFVNMMKKVEVSYKRLIAVSQKAQGIKEVDELLTLFKKLNLKPGNRTQLEGGASLIALKARQFTSNHDGSKLGELDNVLPKKANYVWENKRND